MGVLFQNNTVSKVYLDRRVKLCDYKSLYNFTLYFM